MKILHASHKGLPDHRIERAAYVARMAGHEVEFLGMGSNTEPILDVFGKVTMLRSINNRQAALDTRIRQEWTEAIDDISPDLVHANDIIPGRFTSLAGYPMVYDDHEYWSKQIVQFETWPFFKRVAIRPFIKAIPNWEKDILSNHVTITVSDGIASEHRRICRHVFVLQNYCLGEEVKGLPINPDREGVVFVGADFSLSKFAPYRDLTGLQDEIEFDIITGVTREDLYIRLTKYRFGLVPFRPHPYHRYANSAKLFDYLAAGLQVMMNHVLFEAHGRLPFTHAFRGYADLSDLLETCEPEDPETIMDYSHRELVWERQKDTLLEAYEVALNT